VTEPPPPLRSAARLWAGLGLGVVGLAALTVALVPHGSLTDAALLYLVPVVAVAAVGGVWPGLAAAAASDLLLNWFFAPPVHTLTVERRDNLIALLVYVLVAVTVSVAVDLAARQRAAAVRSGVEARLQAGKAAQLAEVDRLRTAILASVGHDLRTPLASIKAAASSLRAGDVAFSPTDRDELLATVEESADRLEDLVENLLAMSRLQAGVLSVQARPVALDEVVARALLHAPEAGRVEVEVGDDLPLVSADPGLLERVVANLVSNAVRAAAGGVVTLRASASPSTVDLTVVDHGPGVPAAERERIFAPFQRLDDHTAAGGLGLGLAIARGFAQAMGGTVTPGDTPGGGMTMTVSIPRSSP